MRILLGFLFVFSSIIFFGNSASAKDVTVNNPDELIKAVDDLNENTIIHLSKDFILDKNITLSVKNSYQLIIYSNEKKLDKIIRIDMYVKMKELGLRNFAFDGEGKKAIGFQFDMKPTSEVSINIENSSFENSTDAVLTKLNEEKAHYRNKLSISNTLIKNNKSKKHGVVEFHDSDSLNINNSSLIGNENSSNTIGGGATTIRNVSHLNIRNSIFEGNKLTGVAKEGVQLGGGATTIRNVSHLNIRNSIFEGNKLTGVAKEGVQLGGGAIYSTIDNNANNENGIFSYHSIYRNNQTNLKDNQHGGAIFKNNKHSISGMFFERINNQNTAFIGNKSSGYGGAIAFQTDPLEVSGNQLPFKMFNKNLIFAENESIMPNDKSIGGGSAIAFFRISSDNYFGEYRELNSEKVTYYKNSSSGGKNKKQNSTVFVDGYDTRINMMDSVFGYNQGEKNYENINTSGNEINNKYSFGIDNGEGIPGESEKIFGKYPMKLRNNFSEIRAGYEKGEEIIPSIYIIPKFTNNSGVVSTGIANEVSMNNSIGSSNIDIREFFRGKLMSSGAVDTTSILYDANGGNFKKKELTEFTGKEYYEGNNPTQIAKLYLPMARKQIASASKDLKITKKGANFIGWSTNPQALKPDPKYAQNKIVTLEEQLKLYAVWNNLKHNVRFYSNGKTTGILSKSFRVNQDDEIEIPKTIKVKRKGYKFIGWSYLPTTTKIDKTLSPGNKLKVSKSLKIYAVWKKI